MWNSILSMLLVSTGVTGTAPVADAPESITQAYHSHSEELGAPQSPLACDVADSGCVQDFKGGKLHWNNTTGAHPTFNGEIQDKWGEGRLGHPLSDPVTGLRRDGQAQEFENGTVYHSPASGTAIVKDEFKIAWEAIDAEEGNLGYPLSDEYAAFGFKRAQKFEGGYISETANGIKIHNAPPAFTIGGRKEEHVKSGENPLWKKRVSQREMDRAFNLAYVIRVEIDDDELTAYSSYGDSESIKIETAVERLGLRNNKISWIA